MKARQDKESNIFCKFMVIGNEQSGKSTLVLRYADNQYTDSYISRLGVEFKAKRMNLGSSEVHNHVWEKRLKDSDWKEYRFANAIIITVDLIDDLDFFQYISMNSKVQKTQYL